MSTYEYVGARYVPIFADPVEWDINRAYEALTIVTYNNDCYTSKIPVPVGTQITNTTYWMNSSNFNTKIAELFDKFPVSIQDGGTGASTAAGARTNLDVAQNNGASITLYDAEQNEADLVAKVGNVNVAGNGSLQSQIYTLQNLVSMSADIDQVRFYGGNDWFDIRIRYPSDSEYPYRVLSFSRNKISFQKRPPSNLSDQAVELWSK